MHHIAILDVDVPVPTVYAARGLYSSIFKRLLLEAASRLNIPATSIHFTAFDVVGGCLPPLASLRKSPRPTANGVAAEENPLAAPIDAILITGAAAAAYEAAKYPWIIPVQSFIHTVFEEYPHVKLYGSCWGHQLLAQALLSAASLTQKQTSNPPTVAVEACPQGREMGLESIALTQEFMSHFPLLETALRAKGEMRLQMIHGDWVSLLPGVKELPKPWVNVGSTRLCPIQGLYYPGRVLTLQGHFEFDTFVNNETCKEFAKRSGWKDEDVEEWLELIGRGRVEGVVEDQDDARAAAEVVLLFFLQ
ncbi:class I glutamine amidotransferase-like protein [Aspergillus undulatus]|uniref:class I glutamine amidotransferase-like protein n=1 Tax=Aspergillus undulatus TaxID=1810928 RepID=UPI003CCDBDB9